ncbi:UDP-3-O-acyl-N-acetylglucosamine deacetylase [Prochlorococcus marinus XMU1414]|uniref:UDP-3-O-acyl-N-acetylglucosamine deacetylase n=1 Tax=Prochlorococcus marinus XMU1424 TaxID=2774497 RepID=A0A9D9BXG7_PROMR|nr:UDP-3-O-acyl-N-acetylglucosamine deacetylase [Prochlorococcus marinus]MBO8228764.1 UDP-3-O-acyl-N-acetylglucosamine deacetylase [Prochlorococcus marinus XMU1414]MBW3046244.1 UDP-3-O-acyl-N-acetylglucosamine deacetylase [Prochlorococcus marinus str. MU1414]MCR8531466.1 UDP-3-O-acyl-N-acetylglucosamine deacetylase [Prochlorococcus marinus XMU1420]MCR8535194.1 UDP-3-O-acyl-N-acetylglucosamine deacetylase [Prochlorococcus marinus XMU1424]
MFSWPTNYDFCYTLAGVISREGIGLHSGEKTRVTISPYEKEGYYVSFKDKPGEIFKLTQDLIGSTMLCTAVKLGGRNLYTIEHLLSSMAGCGLSYIHIEVEGKEIPLLDGSAIQWVKDFEEVGIKKAPRPDNFFQEINKSIILNKEDSVIAATPSKKTTIISTINFAYKAIGNQTFAIDLNPKNFVEMIAPARTFGFKDQFQELSELGLIKGGSLENALVCDGEKWVNPPLRFDNEPIRHKILDLIGDLALVGLPKAQILVYKGSHSLNALLASSLKN